MGKIIFVLGGARSGKSNYALAKVYKKRSVAFIATAGGNDKEMRQRILKHKNSRPSSWKTFEEPIKVSTVLRKTRDKFDFIILDCMTLFVSNLMLAGYREKDIYKQIKEIISIIKNARTDIIIISNEVGLGIVPQNKLARNFRDIAGKTNQIIAAEAEEVVFMVSGIPWIIKKGIKK